MNIKYLRIQQLGFTVLELLVVISIIGVLAGITTISFSDARMAARDDVRQTTLKELALAIEQYRAQYGQYPARGCMTAAPGSHVWSGPGPHANPPGWGNTTHCEEWIVGLVPDFISELPRDPLFEDQENRGYIYWTDANRTAFKVLAHDVVEVKRPGAFSDAFARCPRDCGTSYCSATAPSNPQPTVYAVYSPGAECI